MKHLENPALRIKEDVLHQFNKLMEQHDRNINYSIYLTAISMRRTEEEIRTMLRHVIENITKGQNII